MDEGTHTVEGIGGQISYFVVESNPFSMPSFLEIT